MSNMILGSHTLESNPTTCTMVRPDRICSGVKTYSSFEFFSWGVTIVGKQLDLEWDYLSSTEFDVIDALFIADTGLIFDPQDGKGHTYNVQMIAFEGTYFTDIESNSDTNRAQVKMSLVVMSVAS